MMGMYESIGIIGQKEWVLLKHRKTQLLYVKKECSCAKKDMYLSLKEHPHPNLARIEEVYEKDTSLIVIEEYIQGGTLATYLEMNGYMNENQVKEVLYSLCDVLNYLHNLDQPIIHRDIKPNNIMFDENGVVKLIDFDVSRFYNEQYNQDTTILGTQGYASPEQFGFMQTDARSDIYSLGVLINVMVCGLFPSEYLCEGKLKEVVEKCIAIDRKQRYQTVQEMRRDLKGTLKLHILLSAFNYIPGFRTRKLWKMLVAIGVYTLLGSVAFYVDTPRVDNEFVLLFRQFVTFYVFFYMLQYVQIF